jgi:hypothetical protein
MAVPGRLIREFDRRAKRTLGEGLRRPDPSNKWDPKDREIEMLSRTRLIIVLLAAIVLAAPAFAQYKSDTAVSNQVTVNQCSSAGEPVTLSGNIHAVMSLTTDDSGNHFSITVSNDLTGVGKNSGLGYAAKDSNDYSINTADNSGDLTVEFRSDLVPAGGGIGMMLVQSLHITTDTTGNIGVELKSNVTQCGS